LTKYIRWLDLSHNLLVELPESFCALGYAIDELHVTHNQLATLPQNVDNFRVIVNPIRCVELVKKTDAEIKTTDFIVGHGKCRKSELFHLYTIGPATLFIGSR